MKSIKRFFKRLIKLYKWNKILWNEYDWDYVYLLGIMKFKLDLMEPVIRAGYAENAEKTADEIKKTSELLQLLIDDNFNKNYNKLTEKYGEHDFTLIGQMRGFQRVNVTDENKEEFQLDFKEANRLDNLEKKRVQNEFFKMFKKYENWWD
jgi:hypothetical protein